MPVRFRKAILFPALLLVAAMGKSPEPSVGDACSLLKAIDPSDYLGAAPRYELSTTTDEVEIWGNCSAYAADDSRRISFSVYEGLFKPSEGSVALRDAYMAGEIKSDEDRELYEPADLGEAAMWEKMFKSLIVWDVGGRVRFTLVVHPADAAVVEDLAGRLVAILP